MIFVALLVPFIKSILVVSVTGGFGSLLEDDTTVVDDDDNDDDANNAGAASDKDEKKSFKERMQVLSFIK